MIFYELVLVPNIPVATLLIAKRLYILVHGVTNMLNSLILFISDYVKLITIDSFST